MKKKLTVGILAHVDAGKTTLSEAMLYLSGSIRKQGRVDHKNSFLDNNAIERERGITVFSKQARFSWGETEFVLLDTPGHVDFSAETERTLALLDYAILVISASDGVQNHTRTLWQLLDYYRIPVLIFVNKTDIYRVKVDEIEADLCRVLSNGCVAFCDERSKNELNERLAMLDENIMDSVICGDEISDFEIAELISQRKLFPCFFGSALHNIGVKSLLCALDKLTLSSIYPEENFGAKVYKISNASSLRLTYMKITGGSLSSRDELVYYSSDGRRVSEKISQIRLYSGDKYEQKERVFAGEICAVSGLSLTYAGQGLGSELDGERPLLEPVLSYRIIIVDGATPELCYFKLKQLEEEEPSLHLLWNGELKQIEARLMGDIQTEILKRTILERFGMNIEFGAGRILYKEKVASSVVGIGHFEPLRHYAEVQLLLEPQPKGSGISFDINIPENSLGINWQKAIRDAFFEKTHKGVLTGSPLTDTKVTLVAGRANLKHTEGGDFREATFRAVRHGLMKGGCELLEPYYRFRLEVPSEFIGRAISELRMKFAEIEIQEANGEITVAVGRAPVSELQGYTRELISYTRGKGVLSCVPDGYEPCHDKERVIEKFGYDPLSDIDNTPNSVFCSHGAGLVVSWNEVDDHKHLTAVLTSSVSDSVIPKPSGLAKRYSLSTEEVEAIMLKVCGPIKRKQYKEPESYGVEVVEKHHIKKKQKPDRKLLIVDGYNVIYAWRKLKELAKFDLEKAREELVDTLCNYIGYTKTELIVVFDAYRVKNNRGSDTERDGCRVIYTKEDQTADAYIEKIMRELGPDYNVSAVTDDGLLQISAVSSGILRMTATELEAEVLRVGNEIREVARRFSENR